MKLTITLTDNGKLREAIPVRALPLVTDWFVSADLVAIALAGMDCSFRPELTAYTLSPGGPKAIPQDDWQLIADQVQALDASLPRGAAGKYEWRHRSIAELPSGAFVWADEFSHAYRRAFNNTLRLEHEDQEKPRANGEVRFPAVVPVQLQRIALEGFQSAPDEPTGIALSQLKPQRITQANDTKIRTSQLTAEIAKAKLKALDPGDHQSVWAELSKMALEEEGAFTGVTDSKKGLEYKAHNGKGEQTKKWLSINALRNRMDRAERQIQPLVPIDAR